MKKKEVKEVHADPKQSGKSNSLIVRLKKIVVKSKNSKNEK